MRPKPKEPQTIITLQVPISMQQQLIQVAEEDQRPLSSVVRIAIQEYLKRKESGSQE